MDKVVMISALIAQFPISFSIRDNLDVILGVLEQSRPGELVVFPEGCISGYSRDLTFLDKINPQELQDGFDLLQRETERREVNLWAGACVCENGNWYNTAFGFTPDGERFVYRKVNLATHERGKFSAGTELPVFPIKTPDGEISIGVQLCRELRFPEQWGWLARQGAQIILHLNNATGEEKYQMVWKSHLVSRAAETQRFVLSVNNAAQKQICPTIAIAPDGQVLGEVVSDKLGVLKIPIDVSQTSHWYIDQCRTDIVAIQPSK
jgi:predicted amidohydrolase